MARYPETPTVLEGFPLGMDNRAPEADLDSQALRLAKNVDVLTSGNTRTRNGYAAVSGASGGHSAWSHPLLPYGFYVSSAGNLVLVRDDLSRTDLVGVNPLLPMSYTLFDGRVYYANGVDQGYVKDGVHYRWTLPTPSSPLVVYSAGGSAPAGRYQFALTALFNDGEESGASRVTHLETSAAGSIEIGPIPNNPAVTKYKIYMTYPDGKELFFLAEVAPGTSSLVLSSRPELQYPLRQLHMTPFPPFPRLATFKSYILGAQGRELFFSDPSQASLIDRQHAQVRFDDDITHIAPVEDGVYVGTGYQTLWLAGDDPTRWAKVTKDPVYGITPMYSSFHPPTEVFADGRLAEGIVACWMSTETQLCVGRPNGSIQRITGERLAISTFGQCSMYYREYSGHAQIVALLDDIRISTTAKERSLVVTNLDRNSVSQ